LLLIANNRIIIFNVFNVSYQAPSPNQYLSEKICQFNNKFPASTATILANSNNGTEIMKARKGRISKKKCPKMRTCRNAGSFELNIKMYIKMMR